MDRWISTDKGIFNVRFISGIRASSDYDVHLLEILRVGDPEPFKIEFDSKVKMIKVTGALVDFLSMPDRELISCVYHL